MTNLERVVLHKQWWSRTNADPLVGVFAPVRMPFGGLDIDVPPERMAERKLRNAEASSVIPGDKLNVASVNFGPAMVPALAGAGFEWDAHTSWSIPVADRAADLRVKPFDPAHPLFDAYRRRLEPLLANWRWDTYLPGLADYLGPLDILAGMLGPEVFCLELHENPEEIKRYALDAARFLRDVLAFELQMHREAGLTEGVTDCFAQWLPGRGVRFSEDCTALVGERHVRDLFVEADSAWLDGLDSTFLHVHSTALQGLPAILDMANLRAIEISNDPNGPDLDAIIRAAAVVQARGLPVQISNWEHRLNREDVVKLVSGLKASGLCVTLQADSLEEAADLYRLARTVRKGDGTPVQEPVEIV